MMNQTRETVDKIKDFLLKYNPKKIVLFGSSARGDGDEYSDIDICMIIENKPEEGIAEFKLKISEDMLSLGLLTAVDLVVVAEEDFIRQKDSKYSVYKEIAKDGVVLYERR